MQCLNPLGHYPRIKSDMESDTQVTKEYTENIVVDDGAPDVIHED